MLCCHRSFPKYTLNYKPFHIFEPLTSNSGSWGASIIPKKKIVIRKKTGGARQLVDNAEPYDSSKRLTIITTVSKWWYLKGNHKFLVSKISSVCQRERKRCLVTMPGAGATDLALAAMKASEAPMEHRAMPSILLVVFHGQNSTNHFAKDFITDLFKTQRANQTMRNPSRLIKSLNNSNAATNVHVIRSGKISAWSF